MIRKRTNSYWVRRSLERLSESEATSKIYMKKITKLYEEAERRVLRELSDIYAKYYDKEKGFDKQLLDLFISERENKITEIRIEKLKLDDKLPDYYKGRITRLESLQKQIWEEIKKLNNRQEKLETEAHRKTFEENYYRVGYDVSKGIGSTPISFSALDKQTINEVLNTSFECRNYNERIWRNTDILANQLRDKLTVAIATGQGVEKTAREFRERFGVSRYYAERLVRTETNYFHNRGEIEAYKNLGFEYYEFLATLDNRTSEICAKMDSKKIKVSEGVVGENIPPLHPNCRSTIVPTFKGYKPKTRRYRDPETGRNKFIYNVSYKDWRQTIEQKG